MVKKLLTNVWDGIDFSSSDNATLQITICSYIKEIIISKVLNGGDKLPSQRMLADYIGVSLQTMTRVIDVLVYDGFLYTIPRKGVYVSNRYLNQKINTPLFNNEKTVNLSTNSPSIFSDSIANHIKLEEINLINENIERADMHLINDYLKETNNADYSYDNLYLTYGAYQAIFLILLFLKIKFKKIIVLCEKVSFSPIIKICTSLNIRIELIKNLDVSYQDSVEKINKISLLKPNSKCILFLINPVHNPLLYTLSPKKIEYLSKLSIDKDMFIIEDGVYFFLPKNYISFYQFAPKNTFKVLSTSKFLPSMLRLGFLYLPQVINKQLIHNLYGSMSWSAPLLEAGIFSNLIRSGFLSYHINRYIQEISIRNCEAKKILGDYIYKGNNLGCHILINGNKSKEKLFEEQNILLSSGNNFSLDGEENLNFYRVSLISLNERLLLLNTISKIRNILDGSFQKT